MRSLPFLVLVAAWLTTPAQAADVENFCKTSFKGMVAQKIEDLAPKDWKLLSKTAAEGDIDSDGKQDLAAVFERTSPNKGEGKGEIFPRIFAIFMMNKNNEYRLISCASKLNLTRDSEAFNDVQLPQLRINGKVVELTISGGTVWIHTDVYKFRYEKKKSFQLIGSTHTVFQSAQAEDTKRSIDTNYATGAYEIRSWVPETKERERKKLSKKLKVFLDDFSPAAETEVLKITKAWTL